MFWVLALLSSFIVLSGDGLLSEGASSRPHDINVGAIFSLSTLYGQVADIAMKAAEDDVNSDPTFLLTWLSRVHARSSMSWLRFRGWSHA